MKNFILNVFLISIFFIKPFYAQVEINKSNTELFKKFLPSNYNLQDLKISDIPSPQVLKMIGFSQQEIDIILDYKNRKASQLKNSNDTLIDEFNNKLNIIKDSTILDSIYYPKAKIHGQDIFRNNKLNFFQKAFDAKAPENYKIGPGDQISISVWGFSEFSENLDVDSRGYINPGSYGRIYVKGLTFKKMRSMLKSRFSNFFDMKNSEIDVTLSYSRVITVNIVGEVYKPGSYTIPAINTAFNALFACDGPTQIGSVRNIYIKRDGKNNRFIRYL